jgi:hypothetical protein
MQARREGELAAFRDTIARMNLLWSSAIAALTTLGAFACSSSTSGGTTDGGSGTPGTSGDECGVSGTKTLAAVSDAEKATICDCTNQLEGGYAKSFPCDGGLTFSNKKDQAACIAAWTPCTNATVADGVACAHAVTEHDRCDLAAAIGDARCAYITTCRK